MTTSEIANRLVALCREMKHAQAVEELYAADVETTEASGPPGEPLTQKGIEAVRAKTKWWFDNHVIHSTAIVGPFVGSGDAANQFCVKFEFDVTHKPNDQRFSLSEIGIYVVRDGKVASERFYYHMPSPG